MSVPFVEACGNGDEKKARQLYDSDKSVLNRQDERDGGEIEGFTGLHNAFYKKHFSICRWLLSLPDIDVNLIDDVYFSSALHAAANVNAPFDLVISLAKFSSKETMNSKLHGSLHALTALDVAVQKNLPLPSIAIYLSWLGAECKEENRKFSNVTLQTWLDAGCQQDAPMWAVAAKDLNALRQLAQMEGITVDKAILINLADMFGYQEIKAIIEDNSNLKIYSNQVFCDFEITLKEKSFPCHKIFLAKHSEPIRVLIEEKIRQNLPMKTELENCPNEIVAESFIKFFYIGGIDKDILDWNIVTFLHLSDYFRVKELHTVVQDAMIAQLCNENVKEFIIAADKYQGERVKAAAIEFLRENRGIWAENVEEWKPFISRELLCEIVIKLV